MRAENGKIELVAIDLDGTLLDDAGSIRPLTAATIAAARRAAGVKVVLASARPPRTVMPFYEQLDLDTPMVNYNGALVYDPASHSVLMHRPIPLGIARGIVTLARSLFPGVLVSAEVLNRWYTDRIDEAFRTATAKQVDPDVIGPIDKWLDRDVTKLLLLGPPQRLGDLAAAIVRDFRHQVTVVQTEDWLLQITHATASKLSALRVVAAELGVNRENVMAIGDQTNDTEMIRWAGLGVAMANSTRSVLQAADHVTGSNEHDGVAQAIEKFILEPRFARRR